MASETSGSIDASVYRTVDRSPFHRAPPDILLVIFDWVPRQLEASWGNPDLGLIRICAVCRWWRQHAISAPSLWTKIRYRLICPSETFAKQTTWLTRSAGSLVDIFVRGAHLDRLEEVGSLGIDAVLASMLVCGTRWRSFETKDCGWAETRIIYTALQSVVAPNLISVRADINEREDITDQGWFASPRTPFRDSLPPKLRVLELPARPICRNRLKQLTTLTELRVHQSTFAVAPGDLWDTLQALPLLQILVVRSDGCSKQSAIITDPPSPALTMWHLHTLGIQSVTFAEAFLSFVHLPSLQDIQQPISGLHALEDAFPESCIRLRKLHLGAPRIQFLKRSTLGFSPFLYQLINLESFHLSKQDVWKFHLNQIASSLPKLTQLEFSKCKFKDPQDLKRMIEDLASYERPKLSLLGIVQCEPANEFPALSDVDYWSWYKGRVGTLNYIAAVWLIPVELSDSETCMLD